ncbi:MAG: 4-hydroxy-3-methylbut-2-enyl diphosphate reductase [Actinomycetota bacterium]
MDDGPSAPPNAPTDDLSTRENVAGSPVDLVLLAEPRGFCAGVEMAIKALAWMVRSFEGPVYCYHEIVHNKLVVRRFEEQGVVFVDDIAEVPPGYPIMLSAHGSAPEVVEAARSRGSYVVDSVCPLVTKVHHEVKVRAGKGYRIVYVGHEGHEEAVGTMAVAPDAIDRVETVAEVEALPTTDEPVALLAQTTLSHRDWEGVAVAVRERFPQVWTPGRSDLCFATTNRQAAIEELAHRSDAIVVIGSANSSNTRALEKLAREEGCERVYRINSVDELPHDLSGIVGVTAGASAPEELVEAVVDFLAPASGIELVVVTDEDEYFPPPRNIRELQASIEAAATSLLGGSLLERPAMDDRSVAASSVLAAFAH